jgi:hypothetical protein
MSVFDDFLGQILASVKDEAGQAAAKFIKDSTAEGTAFRADAEANLIRWQSQLANGELDQDLFASLVRGQWDVTVLAALAKAGKSGADAKALGKKILNLAIDSALSMIPGGPVVKVLTQVAVGAAGAALVAGGSSAKGAPAVGSAAGSARSAVALEALAPAAPKPAAAKPALAKPAVAKPAKPAAAKPAAAKPPSAKAARTSARKKPARSR